MRRVSLLTLVLLGAGCTAEPAAPPPTAPASPPPAAVRTATTTRWVALGDSYTKGEAARAEEAWPAVATDRLRASGRRVELVANLGRTGWTSRDVLLRQVPRLDELKADLVTVQVGINDLVQGVSEEEFTKNLRALLEALVKRLGTADRVIAVGIPDFSITPAAPRFGDPERLHADIAKRNAIIGAESAKLGIRVAQVFDRSREGLKDGALIASDGIHPSAKGYAAWVPDVMPALEAALGAASPR